MGRTGCVAALVAAAVLGASCGDAYGEDRAAGGRGPLVLATTSIWADITAGVACDGLADVASIIPPGGDAHSFEPSLADRGRLQDAALVVANGVNLEHGLADTLDSARGDGAVVFTVADHVDLATDHDHDDDHETEDGSGAAHDDADQDIADHAHDGADHVHDQDPHLWLDPHLVDRALDPLGRALIDEAGLDAEAVAACTQQYRQALAAVDGEVEALVAQLEPSQRVLVTSHGSFDHFARRYGFEVVGTVIPGTSSMAEPNPAALHALADTITAAGVPAIFTEVSLDERDARALADQVGAEVVGLHIESLGPDGSGAETYLELVRTDARLIVDALGENVR